VVRLSGFRAIALTRRYDSNFTKLGLLETLRLLNAVRWKFSNSTVQSGLEPSLFVLLCSFVP
jgi:hypothetical protein